MDRYHLYFIVMIMVWVVVANVENIRLGQALNENARLRATCGLHE